MDISTIIGISISLIFAGLGIGLGSRLLQLRRASSQEARDETARTSKREDDERLRRRLTGARGRRRTTTIHGVNREGFLRHTDGSYTKAYSMVMPATLYADDTDVDRLYNDWARMLQSVRQAGVVIQTRHDVWSDSGRALRQHLEAQAHTADTYMPARMLHTVGLTGTEAAARDGFYQDDRLTLWVRVPVQHKDDPSRARLSRLIRFFPACAREMRRLGVTRIARAVVMSWTRTNREQVFARARAAEREAARAAS
ncbi:MAG TPA: hypothetical protein VE821_14055, partial [Pyrinomonadaceae bacterium]|nr:hypothetical protein [Pyrinomonadaceae bacterium]